MVKVADSSFVQNVHQYHLIGRAAPTQKHPNPKIFRMRLFARDQVQAKSKFWYFMRKLNKAKKSGGQVLAVSEIFEKNTNTVKNFGVWLRYQSRSGTHNMYKEYRDISQNGVISQMYSEMAGRHRALASTIQILKVAEITDAECKRVAITQYHASDLKFPLIHRIPLINKAQRTTFNANRPCTYKQ